MCRIILAFVCLFLSNTLFCADRDSIKVKYANYINAEDLKKHLYVLASPEYEGRETGMKGQKMAAAYLANIFKNLGLSAGNNGSFYQEFPLIVYHPEGVNLTFNDALASVPLLGEDYFYYLTNFNDTVLESDLLFLGYGISDDKYDDYKGVDVKDKILLVLDGEPFKEGKYIVSGTNKKTEWTINYRKKIHTAHEKGAKGILIIKNEISDNVRHMMEKNRMKLDKGNTAEKSIYSFFITKNLGEQLLSLAPKKRTIDQLEKIITKEKKTIHFELGIKGKIEIKTAINKIKSENVLAFIEGTDLKDEIVVITAHYDHLGIKDGKVYVGADDDGSGTVALLEVAEAFSVAKKEGYGPRRSLLFMPVAGEEKGLLGSDFYSDHPVYPLKNTVVNLNIDMIGRIDEKHAKKEDFIYLIGSDKLSTELHTISEEANANHVHLEIDYTFNQPNDPNRFYYRSDHYNFAKHNIPVIFYFNGTHSDYHQASDTPDKINYDLMAKRAKLVFFTAWELVNRDERIKVDVENDFKNDN